MGDARYDPKKSQRNVSIVSIPVHCCSSSVYRFRWAVCQLDRLKRLEPKASTIRAELSNLPKTLDETYERIFLAIPEEDWLSVQHVFHWLVYHRELFGTNIPLSTLLQAVQQSTLDLLSSDADPLYNFDGLRERCGCLITVEQEEIQYAGTRTYHKGVTISFAHYTVKEYLHSSRISQKKVGFFALGQEHIRIQFARIALHQALAIQRGSLTIKDWEDKGDIYGLLDGDFKAYCGVFSVLQLRAWGKTIASDVTLMELSATLVNPRSLAYDDLSVLMHLAEPQFIRTNPYWPSRKFQFWRIHWSQEPGPEAAIFLGFLLISDKSDTPHLAHSFAKRHSMLAVLTQQLHVTKHVYVLGKFDADCPFVGSIPEMAAQWAFSQPRVFHLILDLISELGTTHFDLSKLLVLYLGCHQHQFCGESCALERLLRLGASVNGPEGAYVTSIQIATACWDFSGVELLLNAGADPNALGSNGSKWTSDSLMERFNHLNGSSPLHILNHFGCNYMFHQRANLGIDDTMGERIEARLLEIGAVDIEPEGLEPASADFSDDDYASENRTEESDDPDS